MKQKQSGSGLIFAVVLLFVILGMVITLSSLTMLETKMNQKTKSSVGAFYGSESGVEWALNQIAIKSGTNPLSDITGVGNSVATCPPGVGDCKVYFLDSNGKVLASTATIDQVKAVRSVGTQGDDTQRAIEAAVPKKNIFKTSAMGCRGILTMSDTCPSLLGYQSWGGGKDYFDYFLDCEVEGEIRNEIHMTPLDCPVTDIPGNLIDVDKLKVGKIGCGQYVTTSDTCLTLYDHQEYLEWPTPPGDDMNSTHFDHFKTCDGTSEVGGMPLECATDSLSDAGFGLDDLKVCPPASGGYVTVADQCPSLYYAQSWGNRDYFDFFLSCDGSKEAKNPPVMCPSSDFEF